MEEIVNNVEVYTSKLAELTDSWLEERLDNDFSQFKKSMSNDLMFWIRDRIILPTTDEIEKLDALFDAYVRICCRLGTRPTLFQFSILCGIDNCTFSDWLRGEFRTKCPEYGKSVKRWKSVCEGVLASDLTNSDGSSANMIFALKANYGWVETAPLQIPVEQPARMTLDQLKLPQIKKLEEKEV